MKLYWVIKNEIHYWLIKFLHPKNTGLLSHRKDIRDKLFEGSVTEVLRDWSLPISFWFNQSFLNICVFASRGIGLSNQNGIRFSVRWLVKLARHFGMTKGDGFSYLRAGNELVKNYGLLPYVLMPDEVMSWEEYSKWTPEDEALLKVAENYKARYSKVVNTKQAMDALQKGYVLFTASEWFQAMFNPQKPDFKLLRGGNFVGGHAYYSTGYRNYGDDFENPQTFGASYGDNGKAWIDNLFGRGQYEVYVQDFLPLESYVHYITKILDGKLVKGTKDEIYIMDNGLRRLVSHDTFIKNFNSFTLVKQEALDAVPFGAEFI